MENKEKFKESLQIPDTIPKIPENNLTNLEKLEYLKRLIQDVENNLENEEINKKKLKK